MNSLEFSHLLVAKLNEGCLIVEDVLMDLGVDKFRLGWLDRNHVLPRPSLN